MDLSEKAWNSILRQFWVQGMYKNNGIKTKRICFLTYLANEKIQSNNIHRNNISSTIHFKFPPLCIMLNLLHREFKTFSLILPYFHTYWNYYCTIFPSLKSHSVTMFGQLNVLWQKKPKMGEESSVELEEARRTTL